ncbi:MucBP domain-containing protein, partial [Bacillus cereus]|nr:MucBP domain-containing protein [Bacillus cereus]
KDGKELVSGDKTTDKVGKDYKTEAKEIPGYKLVEQPKNAEGKYVEGTTEVVYVYEKIEEPKTEPKEGKVVTKYVDKDGKEIAQRNTTTDQVGKAYTTEFKEIPGYKLVEQPKNVEGKYVERTTEVVYVYEKVVNNDINNNVDKESNTKDNSVTSEVDSSNQLDKEEHVLPKTGGNNMNSELLSYVGALFIMAGLCIFRRKQL